MIVGKGDNRACTTRAPQKKGAEGLGLEGGLSRNTAISPGRRSSSYTFPKIRKMENKSCATWGGETRGGCKGSLPGSNLGKTRRGVLSGPKRVGLFQPANSGEGRGAVGYPIEKGILGQPSFQITAGEGERRPM